MDRDKREFREHKRKLKQLGSQRRRRILKRDLIERPEEAPYSEADFGRYRTADLNGRDHSHPFACGHGTAGENRHSIVMIARTRRCL